MAEDFGFFSSSESGAPEAAEEDPAAAFLAQQESEIAGIENDPGFGAPAASQVASAQPGLASGAGSEDMSTTVNGDVFQVSRGGMDWREKAKKDLEEWNQRQSEQVEKNKINNRASEEAFVKESKEETPGTEWEKVAQLCDFNPKSSKQCKDVSRLRSVLMSLKQTPLSR
ncbi:clathrin, light polypeptide (Lcb), isoform CRA_a [Mus musculus]|nr:clathrin, light polypeptide (Lcb), isoform CRA_a [Mus musculus]